MYILQIRLYIKIYCTMLETQKNNDVIQQIKKLVSRVGNLSQTKLKFFDFLIRSQQMFNDNSKSIKKQIENFQDTIAKKSFYSIAKCKNMKRLIFIYKHLCNFIEVVAKLNIDYLGKVDINSSKLQEKLVKKSDQFNKAVADYNSSQYQYNKKYAQYQYLCEKLNGMIAKSKSFQDPITFYNLNTDSDFSKNLDKKYHQSQNKQLSLTSFLQFLDQKRKRLTQNLKDIREDYVLLLHTHLTSFHSAVSILADSSKDEMYNMQGILAVQESEGDVFNQQIQRFDIKYGKQSQRQDQMFSDLKQLFNSNSQDIQISSDERLFLDRCETFINKKCESVEQFLFLQKKTIQLIQSQIANCQKIDKQCLGIQKSIFKSNGTQDFKKKIQKYFGEGTLNLITLCFLINDVPKRRYDKVGKMFQSHQQKLKKIVQKKQEQLKKFKKRTTQLLSEHLNASKGLQNNLVSVSQFKGNIEKTFATFKNIYDEFTKNQTTMDLDYQQIVKIIIAFIKRQSQHCQLNYVLKKQKQKILYNNVFKKFNPDTEIIEIVKQDTRYEVLFNDPLKPVLLTQFKSQIQKKKYEETKKVLKNKQYHTRSVVQSKKPGCCGMMMSTGRVNKYSKIKSFKASLFTEGTFRPGKLQILNRGLSFEQKKKNLFAEKIQLIILTKDVLSFCQKNLTQGHEGIEITTRNGPISFETEQFHQLEENLQKHLGTKPIPRDNNNNSRHDKSSGDSSSFMKQNTSTQYKVSFEKSVLSPQVKSNLNKWNKNNNNDAMILKQLIDKWKKQKLLSEFFIVQSMHPPSQSTGSVRTDYRFQNDVNKFILKQKRSIKIPSPNQNLIQFIYQWKVSFPQMPMLKSFTHAQDVRIQIAQNIVKIKVTQRNRGQSHLFIRKTFYNEIDKMNKNLSDFIVKTCQREGQVVIDQEPQSEQSTILLDLQNLAIDKQQIQSKNGAKYTKRPSMGNSDLESIKGGGSSRNQGSQI